MNYKRSFKKLQILLFLLILITFPSLVYAFPTELLVGGENIGIEVKSEGVFIVGFYEIDGVSPGKDANLMIGDRIIKVEDIVINEITDLSKAINDKNNYITISYIRNNKEYTTELKIIKDSNNTYKTGIYVKDTIVGIGTLTFINPETLEFGALGHEIIEKNSGKIFEINSGEIFSSKITSVTKGTRASAGEKNATFYRNVILGSIFQNGVTGVFGNYDGSIDNKTLMEVGNISDIELGTAYIKTVIEGNKVETFKIKIIKIDESNQTKNILFEVTDPLLIEKTNGIIQGMSGSPIVQNNKIIGAVTHVLSDNPRKGYGIFITNMLKELEE